MAAPGTYEKARFELADLLRHARRSRNMTGHELSEAIHQATGRTFSQSKISKIETRRMTPSLEDVNTIVETLAPHGTVAESITELAHSLHSELASWEQLQRRGTAPVQAEIYALEETARKVGVAQISLIPGLLQTAAYAREVFTRLSTNRGDLGEAVAARLERQQLLDREGAIFEFLIAEWVLRIPMLQPPLMDRQLERIASVSRRSNVRLGILPLGVDPGVVLFSPFEILDDTTVIIESHSHQQILRQASFVSKYRDDFEAMREASVFGDEARGLIMTSRESLTPILP